jgi:hypothetical protein
MAIKNVYSLGGHFTSEKSFSPCAVVIPTVSAFDLTTSSKSNLWRLYQLRVIYYILRPTRERKTSEWMKTGLKPKHY